MPNNSGKRKKRYRVETLNVHWDEERVEQKDL